MSEVQFMADLGSVLLRGTWPSIVGAVALDGCSRCRKTLDCRRAVAQEETLHRRGIGQLQLRMGTQQQLARGAFRKLAAYGRTGESGMTGHKNFLHRQSSPYSQTNEHILDALSKIRSRQARAQRSTGL